jgi:hypothetical protein
MNSWSVSCADYGTQQCRIALFLPEQVTQRIIAFLARDEIGDNPCRAHARQKRARFQPSLDIRFVS